MKSIFQHRAIKLVIENIIVFYVKTKLMLYNTELNPLFNLVAQMCKMAIKKTRKYLVVMDTMVI